MAFLIVERYHPCVVPSVRKNLLLRSVSTQDAMSADAHSVLPAISLPVSAVGGRRSVRGTRATVVVRRRGVAPPGTGSRRYFFFKHELMTLLIGYEKNAYGLSSRTPREKLRRIVIRALCSNPRLQPTLCPVRNGIVGNLPR